MLTCFYTMLKTNRPWWNLTSITSLLCVYIREYILYFMLFNIKWRNVFGRRQVDEKRDEVKEISTISVCACTAVADTSRRRRCVTAYSRVGGISTLNIWKWYLMDGRPTVSVVKIVWSRSHCTLYSHDPGAQHLRVYAKSPPDMRRISGKHNGSSAMYYFFFSGPLFSPVSTVAV